MPDYCDPYEVARLGVLRSKIPAGTGRAVDLGCNDGTVTQMLADKGYDAIGVDLDADKVASGRRARPHLDLRQGSALETASLGPRRLTTCLELIEHLEPPSQAQLLASIAEATPAGGRLVLSTPGRYSLYGTYERARLLVRGRRAYDWWDPTHVGVMSWRRLRRHLAEAGFVVDSLTGYHYLPPRLAPHFAVDRRPLARMGFDLIVVATRR
jgi:2-polyprenyl-3-methyl-5-hydroxy-6-metoxy-1,4-benzoquinol methylase